MPLQRMVMQLGMGTDIRGSDYTKAAVRAVENAIRQNTLVVADAFDVPREEMNIDVVLGAMDPDAVDRDRVAQVLPYGKINVTVEKGGMDTPKDDGTPGTILVNAAVFVSLELPNGKQWVVAK